MGRNADISNKDTDNSSMGEMKSKDVGAMSNAGRLGGEMVRRMIKSQEEQLAEQYRKDGTLPF